MEFNIGKVFIKVMVNETLVVVIPIADHAIAIKAELFRVGGNNSIELTADAYHNGDIMTVAKVQRWLRGE